MSQATYLKCKRFLARTGICTHCKTNNNAPPSLSACRRASSVGTGASPACSRAAAPISPDLSSILSEFRASLASLSSSVSSLDGRIMSLKSGLAALARLDARIEALDAGVRSLESAILRMGSIETTVQHLSALADGMSARLDDLSAGHASLVERCSRLESAAAPRGNSRPFTAPANDLIRDFTSRVERMENERRDHELIIFGLPGAASEDRVDTVSRVAAAIGVVLSPAEVAGAFRISGRDPASPPLVVKLSTITRRNELLARARRFRGLTATVVNPAWPANRITIHKRSSSSERRLFSEAKSLAGDAGIGFVWMRRGVTYFRRGEGSPSLRYRLPPSDSVDGEADRSSGSGSAVVPSPSLDREHCPA